MKKILPSIVTTDNFPWRPKIAEAVALGLKEVGLFVTCLDEKSERIECYGLLKKNKLKVPFVHARAGMDRDEFHFLINELGTEFFNVHSETQYPLPEMDDLIWGKMLIENTLPGLKDDEVHKFAGICLDTSHLENDRILEPWRYENTTEMLKKFPVIANHVNGILQEKYWHTSRDFQGWRIDSHTVSSLSNLDYLKNLPKEYFGQYIALEMNDNIKFQLEAKSYIEKLIFDEQDLTATPAVSI